MLERVATWMVVTVTLLLAPLCSAQCSQLCVCPWLTFTNCSAIGLTHIPHDISPRCEILDLSDNRIPEISFSYLPSFLRVANFSRNNITRAIFPYLQVLTNLDLSWNAISSSKNVDVAKLNSLEELNLAGNLKSGEVDLVVSKSLEVLDLSYSYVTGFKVDSLKNLPRLKKLILANSSVKSLTHLESRSLTDLDVSRCEISHITSRTIQYFPALLSLDISSNKNLRLSLDSNSCLPLKKVDFFNTGLAEVSISSLCKIEELNFAYNSIQCINEQTFKFNPYLKNLNLSFNNVNEISKKAFLENKELRYVDLSNNHLYKGEWAEYLTNVRFLNLSANHLERIDDFKLEFVLSLDLSHNKITSFDADISQVFPLIEFLNLRSNLIEYIKPMTSNTLKNLKLGYCQLNVLDVETFKGLPKLDFLDLEGNKLKRLDYKTFAILPNLLDVRLGHNPWTCTCSSEQFTHLYTYLLINHTLADEASLRCDEIGKTWLEACPPTFQRTSPNLEAIFLVVGLLLVAFVGMFGLIYCRTRKTTTPPESIPAANRILLHRTHIPPTMFRAHSESDINRSSVPADSPDVRMSNPPPSYDEALLLPPLSETERMTRSMDVLVGTRNINN